MNALQSLIERGGPVMIVIMVLSVLLYTQCFKLLLTLRQSRRSLDVDPSILLQRVPLLEAMQEEVHEDFNHQRLMLSAMIAAAPLLGLLGTVSGMSRTFESLSSNMGQKSMEDLAGGISEVLVATESGLTVAIPALVLVYLAHRQIDKHKQKLNQLKEQAWRAIPS